MRKAIILIVVAVVLGYGAVEFWQWGNGVVSIEEEIQCSYGDSLSFHQVAVEILAREKLLLRGRGVRYIAYKNNGEVFADKICFYYFDRLSAEQKELITNALLEYKRMPLSEICPCREDISIDVLKRERGDK